MTDHISIRPAEGTWVVRANGAVIGESEQALELTEAGSSTVIYFPRADLAMALLDRSSTRSSCPFKGEASYFAIMDQGGIIKDAAWSYEAPKPGMEAIAGHLAFYPGKVTVEQV